MYFLLPQIIRGDGILELIASEVYQQQRWNFDSYFPTFETLETRESNLGSPPRQS
jgi:hypothetical protein